MTDNTTVEETDKLHSEFYEALTGKSLTCIRILLEKGVIPNKQKIAKILFDAMNSADVHVIKNIIIHCPDIIEYYNKNCEYIGFSEKVTKNDYFEIIKLLIENGLDVNKRVNNRNIPLIRVACAYGYFDIANMLIDRGVNIDVQGDDGHNALTRSIFNNHTNCALLLITKGATLDLRTIDGDTALMIAVQKNNMRVISELLYKGARKDILNNKLQSAKDIADELNYKTVASHLYYDIVTNKISGCPTVTLDCPDMLYVKIFIIGFILIIISKIF